MEKERAEVLRQFKENLTRLTLYTGVEYSEDVELQRLIGDAEVSGRFDPERLEQTPEYQAKKKEVEASGAGPGCTEQPAARRGGLRPL